MTSTVQDRKPPSAGTKVEPGNAPVVQEGAGKVASESLAAESKREGGEFASNKGIRSENASSESQSSESKSLGLGKSTGSSENTQSKSSRSEQTSGSSAGEAPTYIEAVRQTDPKGPHGKNLKEGGGDDSKEEDGLKKALESEPGSENDPSRLAEKKFNQSSGGGPRQTSLDTETKYDVLNPEEST